jgi:hypothetical protein
LTEWTPEEAKKQRPLLYWLSYQIFRWSGNNLIWRAVSKRLIRPKGPFWANKKNFFLSALAAAVWIYAALGFVR